MSEFDMNLLIEELQERNNNLKEDFKRHIDRINELTERNDKLSDHITNLQEENEYSNHCNEELRKKITNLEYKIKRLEEDNKQLKELCDKYEEEHRTTFEEWKKDIKANKKAIEYIEQIIDFVAEDKREIERDKYILKLLKGDNK